MPPLSTLERSHHAAELEMKRLADEAAEIRDSADGELDEEQTKAIEAKLAEVDMARAKRDELAGQIEIDKRIRAVGRDLDGDESPGYGLVPGERQTPKSLGEQFVEHESFRRLVESDGFNGSWSTGLIELGGKAAELRGKATLLEGDLSSPGTGGATVPYVVQPGIMPILYERLTVAGLLASGTTTTNAVRYIKETVATNAAAPVAEGADKPEAALEFEQDDAPVRKIAVFLPVSDEMLEDAAQIRSYIDARLSLFVEIETEDQLLNGPGTGVTIEGLLTQVPVANDGLTSDAQAANDADHIHAALSKARESFLEPDGIVVNTQDWDRLRLLKDQNDNYIAGSPFSTGPGEPVERLWGKRVVVTTAMAEGTALVGAFATGAQFFRRGGLTVEASNSHSDFFRKNLTAIRAERRGALVVYRPQAFATADVSGS